MEFRRNGIFLDETDIIANERRYYEAGPFTRKCRNIARTVKYFLGNNIHRLFYNETAYVVGISRNLWLKRYRQSIKNLSLNDINLASDETEEMPLNDRILRFLSAAGQKCMDLLKSFYYDDLALSEIAREFGYSGVRGAAVI